ncbi:MAG: hypothetical protein WAK23_04400, partial [Terriglobales bacterium]
MLRLTRNKSRDRTRGRKHCPLPSRHFCGPRGERLPLALLAVVVLSTVVMLSSCGSGSYGGSQNINLNLSGNWQFTMAPPPDGSFFGGLQGGFLLQNNGSITGAATYAVSLSNLLIPCNAGSAAITGSISGQNVKTITAVAGTQTFTLAGTLSLDGTSMAGTYSSTAGTAPDGAP